MTDFKKGISLVLKGLPPTDKHFAEKDNEGGENTEKEYSFFVGFLNHVPEKDMVFLHIPEITHRDAEGRPLYPEQERWVNAALTEYNITAEDYWFSHWKFKSEREAEKFVNLLLSFNAFSKD